MTSSSRAIYRTRQVVNALWPRIDDAERDEALALLNQHEARLFLSMERRDQRHALEVLRRLRPHTANQDVQAAALLHDCGKGAVPVWLRILKVAWPAFVRRTAREGSTGWKGAAYRLMAHESLSARLAESAGSSPGTIRFIAGTPLESEREPARLLAAADDAS